MRPVEHAYLNQELAPLSLYGNSMGLPLSLCHRSLFRARDLAISSYTHPSLAEAAPSCSLTLAHKLSTCKLKWASEA